MGQLHELRDFNQVYGPFVSEHPYPTDVPDYRLVPPALVTSGCPDGEVRPNKDFEAADWKEAWITGEAEVLSTAAQAGVTAAQAAQQHFLAVKGTIHRFWRWP
ncbi:hypothetical protein JKP88DRAFT_281767 [Tribonema minus]|uniref:Uncharacterized protein n=1 Tax=Tribonema minus TaxID=303371 RepID=A0A835YW99_9STRA|nr:hypothetical protein JKP88DRAFT_281767 [Tribonema minus]